MLCLVVELYILVPWGKWRNIDPYVWMLIGNNAGTTV